MARVWRKRSEPGALAVRVVASWLFGAMVFGSGDVHAARVGAAPRVIDFSERVGPRQVSADDGVIGLIVGAQSAKITDPVLYVGGLTAQDRTLCIQLERANGAYSANMMVDLSDGWSGGGAMLPVSFKDRTRHFGEVRGRQALEVAVRVRVSQDRRVCGSGSQIAPASWHDGVHAPVTALVLSPSASASIDAAGGPRGGRSCNRLTSVSGQLTTFDTACVIAQPRCGGPSTLRIRREEDDGARLPPIEAQVRPSC